VRVLLDYRPALRERTGVGEYAHQVAAGLSKRLAKPGDLTLFSSSWKDRLSPGVIPGTTTVDARIPVTFLNLAWHRLEWPPVELLAGSVDVAHSLHPLLMPARRAAQVVTVHDLYFLDQPEKTAMEIRRDYPALAASHARRADAVITVSKYTAGNIRSKLGLDRDTITICPPAAPPWTPVARRNPRGHILFMGTVEPRKNVPALLRAYAELVQRRPDAPTLAIAGKIVDACQREVTEPIETSLLAGRVRLVGYVSGNDREQLYRDASMLVLPSFDEGFGMPVLEAMTLGIPVIISARGALPEVAGEAGLMVEPDDHQGLSAAMERLLTDDGLAARNAAAGIVRARQFSWDATAARVLETYGAAIERRRSRP
jgi:glycosyltransferase involved in cell wall biosynthesis